MQQIPTLLLQSLYFISATYKRMQAACHHPHLMHSHPDYTQVIHKEPGRKNFGCCWTEKFGFLHSHVPLTLKIRVAGLRFVHVIIIIIIIFSIRFRSPFEKKQETNIKIKNITKNKQQLNRKYVKSIFQKRQNITNILDV